MDNNNPDLGSNNYTNQPNEPDQQQPNQQQTNQQYSQQPPNQQYNPQQPPPYNINVNVPPYGYPLKSKVAAGLLGIFLGSFGVHNFYLGYTGKAVAQLLITVCTCGIGAAITGVWGLIEGILVLTGSIAVDGKGYPLRD